MTASPGPALQEWLRAQATLAAMDDDAELLDRVLVASPDLVRRDVRGCPDGSWPAATTQFHLRRGLRFSARVDPVATEVVGRLDGRRTPREALALFAEELGIPDEPFLGGLPGALHRLVDLGFLLPVD